MTDFIFYGAANFNVDGQVIEWLFIINLLSASDVL